MRIALDASRCTADRVTGTEHYALRMLQSLIERESPHHFTLYFRKEPDLSLFPPLDRVSTRVIPFPRLWTHLRFAAALWSDRPDVTFVPAHSLPFYFPGRAVVTIHDLGFRLFPSAHPIRQRLYLELTTRFSAQRASCVLADSQATADDLFRFYAVPPSRVKVIYPGVDAPIIRDVEQVRRKYGLPERYFLFVGTLQPRKNIARIVEAFMLWRAANPEDLIGLVLAGGQGWLYDPSWVEGVPNVHLTGFVDEADKGALLAGAMTLVFPSLYEGFGFPVVEAMHCGIPVITSRTSSLPELVGDAGLLVNPLDARSIADAMTILSSHPELRQELAEKGVRQARRFTWESASALALEALEAVGRD